MSRVNTLREYQKLIDAGMEKRAAEVTVEAVFNLLDIETSNLVKKEDLIATKTDMEKGFLQIDSKMDLILKDFFYMKLAFGLMFALGAIPIIQQALGVK